MIYAHFFAILLGGLGITAVQLTNYLENVDRLQMDETHYPPAAETTKSPPVELSHSENICSADFTVVSGHEHYVDKTRFIRTVRNDYSNLNFCAPKRFTKSTFLSMLYDFFALEVKKNGDLLYETCVGRSESSKFNLFKDKDVFKIGTERKDEQPICEDKFFELHFANYPVIYADFSKITGKNYQTLISGWYLEVIDSCLEHSYIFKNDSLWLSLEDKNAFQNKFFKSKTDEELISMSTDSITHAFIELSKKLYNHFGKKVIVLIDEVDALISAALHGEDLSDNDVRNIHTMTNTLLATICKTKKGMYIEKVVVTSILSMSAAMSNEPSNLIHYRFLENKKYDQLLGFTAEEVQRLIKKKHEFLTNTILNYNETSFLKNTKLWYAGYESVSGYGIYNPWSIVNLISSGNLGCYWAKKQNVINFFRLSVHPQIMPTMMKIMKLERVELVTDVKQDDQHMNVDILLSLKQFLLLGESFSPHYFFLFLCESGYLVCKISDQGLLSMKLPNYELYRVMSVEIFNYKKMAKYYVIPATLATDIGMAFTDLAKNNSKGTVLTLANKLRLMYDAMTKVHETRCKGLARECGLKFMENHFQVTMSLILERCFCSSSDTIECTNVLREYTVEVTGGTTKKPELEVTRGTKKKTGRIDILLTIDQVTFIIELKYKTDKPMEAMKQCLKYSKVMSEFPGNTFIFLAINFKEKMNGNNAVDIFYTFDPNKEEDILNVESSP